MPSQKSRVVGREGNILRHYNLDGMRGVAAIVVLIYHATLPYQQIFASGYLAVDFFFVLSGFVLGSTYEAELETKRLGVWSFMSLRFIRLYPMFLLGLSLAAAKVAIFLLVGRAAELSWTQTFLALSTEIFLFPSPVTGQDLFPLNLPAWSLFFELLINLIFAVSLCRLLTKQLWVVVVISAALMVGCAATQGSLSGGWSWGTIWVGGVRVAFGFSTGIAISRLSLRSSANWAFLLPPAALAFLLAVPVETSLRPLYDSVVAIFVLPALVVSGARFQPLGNLRMVAIALGELSYPLYATHMPLLVFAGMAVYVKLPVAIWLTALIAGCCALALCLGRWVDPFLRRNLTAVLRRPSRTMKAG